MKRLYRRIVLGYYGIFKNKSRLKCCFIRKANEVITTLSMLKYDSIYAEYLQIVSCVPLLR